MRPLPAADGFSPLLRGAYPPAYAGDRRTVLYDRLHLPNPPATQGVGL